MKTGPQEPAYAIFFETGGPAEHHRILGLSNWLGRLFGRRTAAEVRRRNPALEAATKASAEIFERIPLSELIDDARRAELARALYLEIDSLCNSNDAITDCRDRFVICMLEHAAFQVLVIPPPPAEDISGLRDQTGVTGELHAHLKALCRKSDVLRPLLSGVAKSGDDAALETALQRHYWEIHWRLETLNAVRIALGDCTDPDWDKPFLHATCVTAEHNYRWLLELPPALDAAIARDVANACSLFTDIVLSGAADPAAEWRDYHESAGIPMPSARTA